MTSSAPIVSPPPGLRQAQLTRAIFMGIFALVIGYIAFSVINTMGLENRPAAATVAGKEYVAPGSTYVTKVIGGRSYVMPQPKPEMYVLMLNVAGEPTAAAVEKSLYDAVNQNDQVKVMYQRRRFTGGMQVVEVRR